MRAARTVALFVFVLAHFGASVVVAQTASFANFEAAQTNPIRLSADGTRLFAVNTPAGALSVFDLTQPANPKLIAQIPVGVEPVSVNPRTNDEVWVVNQVSDSISVVSVPRRIVTNTIYLKDEPMDVVFAGTNQAFVSISRSNSIGVIDTSTYQLKKTIPVFGGNPRALAVSRDGSKVYAAFALGGNGTSIIPAIFAPPQPPPANRALPAPPSVGLIVKADDPAWSSLIRYTMPDNDVAIIDTASGVVSGYYTRVGTTNLGIAVHPVTGDLFVANTEALNTIRFEPILKGHFVDNRITRIRVSDGQVSAFDLNPGLNYSVLPNSSARAQALAQPTSIVFDPVGTFMYTAAFGTDRVAVIDVNGKILSRIEVGPASGWGANVDPRNKRGPRGLALNAATRKLYVLNRISNTISVIDTTIRIVVRELAVGFDPTPASIRAGRGFLYDAKLSGNGTGSCASCHIDGDMDHLAWDLGDPNGAVTIIPNAGRLLAMHPMKGPMTTQTLRGLVNLTPLHWRGDRLEFAAFNPAFEALMGGTKLTDADMGAFTAYINTLLFQPNPNQNLDRTFSTSVFGGDAAAGRQTYVTVPLVLPENVPCNTCHAANPGPGSNRFIQQAIPGSMNFAQPQKVPQLRNLYQKALFSQTSGPTIDGFGLNHDGHVTNIQEFLSGGAFARFTDTERRNIAAFVMSFDTGTAPAVGYSRTVTAASLAGAADDWTLLEAQAKVKNIDLIAHGSTNGTPHGFFYDPAANSYKSDTFGLGPFTQAQMKAFVQSGDTLTLTGVYPGSGLSTHLGRAVSGVGK